MQGPRCDRPPRLSSNPGATYTLYIDFSGFDYPGTWDGRTPGSVPAYDKDGDPTAFNATENGNSQIAWASFAQKYVGFNVNVTTVDPAGSGLTDVDRKASYDSQAHLMHTIIGGTNGWYSPGVGGVSYVGVAQYAYPKASLTHQNPEAITAAAAHEDGHTLGLDHQHDEATGAEYSRNNFASGNGSYAPTMGVTYDSQRGTWRVGDPAKGNANDVAVLESNLDMVRCSTTASAIPS